MQGFIVNINKAREDDLVVSILTREKLKTTYRFYGARHSTINIGYLIDFETQMSQKANILQLRSIMHLAQKWNLDRDRFYIWQQFVRLFYAHLKDIETIDEFYFELLLKCSEKWHKQNPKRLIIEAYMELLLHEGRLHSLSECFVCESEIEDEKISFARAFLPAHTECIHSYAFEFEMLKKFFSLRKTIFIEDVDIEYLYKIICEGF